MGTRSVQVHPSAQVHPDAQLGAGVEVGPGVIIEADVVVGAHSRLLAGSVLHDGTRLGERVRAGPYAVVAGEPMDSHFGGETSVAIVEDDVTLREFVTVNRATGEGAETRICSGALIMSYAHVSHNSRVGRGCTLTSAVQLGGHSTIGDYAVLAANAMVHQFGRVGEYAMVGGGSGVDRDVLPFMLATGNPVRHYRLNRVGLLRHGINGERYAVLEDALRALRRRDLPLLQALAESSDDVRRILALRSASTRGVARFVSGG